MGLARTATVFCDGEGCPVWEYANSKSTSDIVKEFRAKGWTFTNGKFYCPDCTKKMMGGK